MTLGLGRSTSSVCMELLCLLDRTEKLLSSMFAGLKGNVEGLRERTEHIYGGKRNWDRLSDLIEKLRLTVLPSTAPAFPSNCVRTAT